MAPSHVVTLVHGTILFRRVLAGRRRRAMWINDVDPHRDGLRANLAAAGCTVVTFEWNGANSHRARNCAADELAGHLREQAAALPEARQTVVAHSHGGNVALHAVHRLRAIGDPAGSTRIVTLATPFIHAREREISAGTVLLAVVFGVVTAWLGLHAVALRGLDWRAYAAAEWCTVVLGVLFLLHVAPCLLTFARRGLPHGDRAALVAAIHAPQVTPGELLAVRAAGDEATATLLSGQFVALLARVSGLS